MMRAMAGRETVRRAWLGTWRSASGAAAAIVAVAGCAAGGGISAAATPSATPSASAVAPAPSTPPSVTAPPDDPWRGLRAQAKAAHDRGDDAGYRAALAGLYERSGSAAVLLRLVRADAKMGHTDDAIADLRRYAAAGMVEPIAQDARYASLHADPRAAAVERAMSDNAAPVHHAAGAVALPHDDLLTEDIAYDPASRGFFVSSIHRRKVLFVDERGQARVFLEGEPYVGLAVRDGRLYATFAQLPPTAGFVASAPHPTGVVAIDPSTRAVVLRAELEAPGEHALTDIAVAPDGLVVASDSLGGQVVALDARAAGGSGAGTNGGAGGARLVPFVPAGTFVSPQTPAFVGNAVLVPDYGRGIAAIDRATRAVAWLAHPPEVALDGIDGLYAVGSSLVAVQNGATPPRVVRLALDLAGSRVTALEVLERASPGLGEPTHGVLVGGALHLLADAGWPRFDDDGHVKKDAPPDAPAIWRIPLDR